MDEWREHCFCLDGFLSNFRSIKGPDGNDLMIENEQITLINMLTRTIMIIVVTVG